MRIFTVVGIAAIVAGLAMGPAFAQQETAPNSGDATGPIVILENRQAEPDGVSVSINGEEADRLESATYVDVTSLVHAGTNTLVVSWSGPVPRLNFKVAYERTRNAFKNVIVVRTDSSNDARLREAGSRTITFTIP
jgi:hypothetical protein